MNIKNPRELDPDTLSQQLYLLSKTNERYYEIYDTLQSSLLKLLVSMTVKFWNSMTQMFMLQRPE